MDRINTLNDTFVARFGSIRQNRGAAVQWTELHLPSLTGTYIDVVYSCDESKFLANDLSSNLLKF